MGSLTVYPSKNVEFYAYGDVYVDVRNAAEGAVDVDTDWYLGQDYIYPVGSDFGIFRCGLFFDTSALPDDAGIASAVLSLYGKYDWSDTDFDITVLSGSVIENTPVAADYHDLLAITTSMGTFNTSGWSTAGYNAITLNNTGIAAISKTGTTKLALRSSREIAGTTPKLNTVTNEESVGMYGIDSADAYKPKLVITYSPFIPWAIVI